MGKFLEGKKTYIGIALILFGIANEKWNLGFTEEASQKLMANLFEAVGTLVTIYGRIKAKGK